MQTQLLFSFQKESFQWSFLCRDCTLEMEIDKKAITSDEYLEHCLKPKENGPPVFNKIKHCIKQLRSISLCDALQGGALSDATGQS